MTLKERKIEETKREISRLEEKLKELEALPDYDENEAVVDMPGFPYTVRIYNCLSRAGIKTFKDFLSLNEVKVRNIRNLGERSAEPIFQWMKEYGHKFYSDL